MPVFRRSGPFDANVRTLLELLGRHGLAQTRVASILLTAPDGSTMELTPGEKTRASCGLLEYLAGDDQDHTITPQQQEELLDFYGPFLQEEGHPTINFLRQGGVRIQITHHAW